jgi:hypothetical protein
MIEPDCSVSLGGLLLLDNGDAVESVDGYTLSVMGEDTHYGNPQPVTSTVYSMLRNGSIVTRDRDENREPVLLVEVAAHLNDGNALALGEKALMAVCRRPAELKWTPPQAGASPVVFDVVDSNIDWLFDDMEELHLRRTYRITLSALPHGRGEDEVVVEALEPPPVSPTTVTFDTCDSATGWTTQTGAAASQSGGDVRSALTNVPGQDVLLQLVRTGSVDFTPTKYLIVEWYSGAAAGFMVPGTFTLDGGAQKVSEQALGDGYTKTYFLMPGDRTSLTFSVRTSTFNVPWNHWFGIRDLKRSDTGPVVATGRQSFRTIEVGGTVTTQGSVAVVSYDETTALGDVAVYTSNGAGGAQPHLSPWQTLPASRTPNALMVSGGFHDLSVTARWQIPKGQLPDGEYLLFARMMDSGGGAKTATFTAYTYMNGVDISAGAAVSQTTNFNLPAGSVWKFIPLGVLNLPTHPIGSDGQVLIDLIGTAGVSVDEVWLYDTSGRLTIIESLTASHVNIHAPSLAEPAGAVWAGAASAPEDQYGVAPKCIALAPGGHDLEPGANNLHVVSTGPPNPSVSARHYERVHSHPYVVT